MRKTLLLALCSFPAFALASGYSLPNVNPRDLSLAAAAVAAQGDSGAALAMPAALARQSGLSVRLGSSLLNLFDVWSDPTGAAPDEEIDRRFTPLPALSASYGGKIAALGDRGWGVGLGLEPFGGGAVFWPDGWEGRYRVLTVDQKVIRTALSAGIEVLPMLRVGGGVVYYYTLEKLSQNFCVTCAGFVGPDATGTLELQGGAVAFDVSAELDVPGVPLRIAVDYKHQAAQTLKGDLRWTGIPAPLAADPQGALLRDQDAQHVVTVPNTLNVGIAYRVARPLQVMFTYTFDRWEVYREDLFVGSEPGATLAVERNYGNGHTIRAGAEYDLNPRLQLRVGVQRDISGLDTGTYSPTLPDASSWAVTAGAGYRFGRGFSVDAGLFYAFMDEVTSTDNGSEPSLGSPEPTGTFRGTYDVAALIYGVSIGWSPGAR
ncbi:MAG TPA: outer membrane protein transport protein [Anaeromyxobacteraceae bacterium]|nr:outer membrane protein transport protein [Anaeromyxobacteraceae bacterium]